MTGADVTPPPPDTPRAKVLLGWLGLHLVVSLRFPWEPALGLGVLRPNPDLFLLLPMAFLLARPGRSLARLEHLVTCGFLCVPVFRFASSVMEVFHGKPLEIYNDVLLLPGLVHLLLNGRGPLVQGLLVVGCLGGALLAYLTVLRLVRWSLLGARVRGLRVGVVTGAVVLFALGWALDRGRGPASVDHDPPPSRLWAEAVLPEAAERTLEIHDHWQEARFFQGLLAKAKQEVQALPQELGALEGVDVYLLFVESYGRTILRTPRTARTFAGWAEAWEERLAAAGVGVCSAAAYPSVRGGASSLAHAEFLCGVQIPNYRSFDSLLESGLEALPGILSRAGHHAVNAQPAMYEPWPEGRAFYGFDQDVFLADFPYAGHTYHWGTMPDQFALWHLLEELVRPAQGPLFLQYVAVTSHAPFTDVPPYFEDWSRLADTALFERGPAATYPITWSNYRGHTQLEEAYMATVHYSLRALLDFTMRLPRPSLVILLGDHQPPGLTELEANDRTYDVPVHVLATEERLLAPFRAAGFAEGMLPAPDFEAFGMSQFLARFLEVFAGH